MRTTFQNEPGKRAFSLTELLVVLGIVGSLAAMGTVAWLKLARSHDVKISVGAVMGALAQARASALASRKEVWVLFGRNGTKSGIVPVQRDGTNYLAGNWTYLAPGASFADEESSAVTQPVPEAVLLSLRNPLTRISGGIQFLPNGSIQSPNARGGQLFVSVTCHSGKNPNSQILLSRATGRATCP